MPLYKKNKADNTIKIAPIIFHAISRSFLGIELTRELLQKIANSYEPGMLRRFGIRDEKHETKLALEELEDFPSGCVNRRYIKLLADYINAKKIWKIAVNIVEFLKKIRDELDQTTQSTILLSIWYFLVCIFAKQLFHSNLYEFSVAELFKSFFYSKTSNFFTMEFL